VFVIEKKNRVANSRDAVEGRFVGLAGLAEEKRCKCPRATRGGGACDRRALMSFQI